MWRGWGGAGVLFVKSDLWCVDDDDDSSIAQT